MEVGALAMGNGSAGGRIRAENLPMKNSLIYVLLVTCIFIAGTAQSAMTQANPSPCEAGTLGGVFVTTLTVMCG